jgi:alkylation response protein AidB-like acyl-CoA dehydrogenase
VIGTQMVGPSIIAHGTVRQKTTFLPRILTGDDIWCQGFSEPNAGSDLASLETRANRVEGGWLLKGQKLWTSRAHTASEMIVLARTNAEAPKHRGITAFLVNMASPGLTVRTVRQINFNDEFNEVFMDDLFVPNDRVLGAVDDGWNVAVNTLNSERIATTRAFEARRLVADLAHADEGIDSQVLEDLTMRAYAAGLTLQRYAAEAERSDIGSKASVTKLNSSELTVEVARAGALGDPSLSAGLPLKEGRPLSWGGLYLNNLKNTIAAGTSQVQRNVIAQRILGMPREGAVR